MNGDQRRFAVLLAVLALVVAIFVGTCVPRVVATTRPRAAVRGAQPACADRPRPTKRQRRSKRRAPRAGARGASGGRRPRLGPTDSSRCSPPATRSNRRSTSTPDRRRPHRRPRPPRRHDRRRGADHAQTSPTDDDRHDAPPSFEPGTGETVAVLDVFNDAERRPAGRGCRSVRPCTRSASATRSRPRTSGVSLDEPCGQFLFGDARSSSAKAKRRSSRLAILHAAFDRTVRRGMSCCAS